MTTIHLPGSPIADRDRRRACRVAHTFGAIAATGVGLLLLIAGWFQAEPVPVLLAAGLVLALAVGLAADLTARPPLVVIRGDWLTVSRLRHRQLVDTGRLTGLTANPRVASSVVLTDEDGNRAEIGVRVLVRNPLIWQQVSQGVSHALRRGTLEPAELDSLLWESVHREVAKADRRALTSIDFGPPR